MASRRRKQHVELRRPTTKDCGGLVQFGHRVRPVEGLRVHVEGSESGALPNLNEQVEVPVCSRVLMKETLFAAVGKGKTDAATTKQMCEVVLRHINQYDPVDLSDIGLSILKEYLHVATDFLTLAHSTLGLLQRKEKQHETTN
jgi:hypothetical protein